MNHNDRNQKSFLVLLVQRLLKVIALPMDLLRQKHKRLTPKLKLVDWYVKESGDGVCRVQIVGTGHVADYFPKEIVVSDELISNFHPHDIRTITNLANLEENKPRKKLASAMYHDDHCAILIKNIDGTTESMSIKQLTQHKENLNRFSADDIFNLGRMAGDEDNAR